MSKIENSDTDDFELSHLEEEMIIVSIPAENTTQTFDDSLQKDIIDKLVNTSQSVDSLKEETKASTRDITEIKRDMKEITSEFKKIKQNLVLTTKFQRLEWAIDHSEIGSFKYFEKGNA